MSSFPDIPGVAFRSIAGFEDYAVSRDGRVWNGRGGRWRVMNPFDIGGGVLAVHLQRGDRGPLSGAVRVEVAALVSSAFGRDRPSAPAPDAEPDSVLSRGLL